MLCVDFLSSLPLIPDILLCSPSSLLPGSPSLVIFLCSHFAFGLNGRSSFPWCSSGHAWHSASGELSPVCHDGDGECFDLAVFPQSRTHHFKPIIQELWDALFSLSFDILHWKVLSGVLSDDSLRLKIVRLPWLYLGYDFYVVNGHLGSIHSIIWLLVGFCWVNLLYSMYSFMDHFSSKKMHLQMLHFKAPCNTLSFTHTCALAMK